MKRLRRIEEAERAYVAQHVKRLGYISADEAAAFGQALADEFILVLQELGIDTAQIRRTLAARVDVLAARYRPPVALTEFQDLVHEGKSAT